MMLALYIFISASILAIARFSLKSWGNPVTVFVGSWLAITLLYQLRLSKLQQPLSDDTYGILLLVAVSFALAFFVGYFFNIKDKGVSTRFRESRNAIDEKRVTWLFYIWATLSAMEVAYSGGVPLLWLMLGSSKSYFDFGIPSLHGFLNALGLVLLTLSFYLVLTNREKGITRMKAVVFFLLAFYAALVTRQILISAAIQMVIILVLVKKDAIPWRIVLPVAVGSVIVFGLVGNFRTGYDSFFRASMIEKPAGEWASGFYWLYMYTTMTLANVDKMMLMNMDPVGIQHVFQGFLPTVLEKALLPATAAPSILVSQNFTVSGFFASSYIGLGSVGVAFMSGAYGVIGALSYKNMQRDRTARNLILYAVILQIISLSFFVNMLLYMPNVFQLVIVFWFFRNPSTWRVRANSKSVGAV